MSYINFELLKNSDPSALVQIHAKYSRSIFWVGKQVIDDVFVVETLMQNTFLKLWDYRDRIESPKHIFFFLRVVMQRECFSYYSKPKNKFFSRVDSLEDYDNYQDYMAGYDPADVIDNLRDQESKQRDFEQIIQVLPLLSAERRDLINLCLKYGFYYKAIAEITGKGIIETSNEVKRAIEDIKNIIHQENRFERKLKSTPPVKTHYTITQLQSTIFKLRCENKCSFTRIALELNLSHKQVHKEFMMAYRFIQQNPNQSL